MSYDYVHRNHVLENSTFLELIDCNIDFMRWSGLDYNASVRGSELSIVVAFLIVTYVLRRPASKAVLTT